MAKEKQEYEDIKLNIRIKLIGLWTVLMLLYIYCDIHTLFRPGQINALINGFMGPFPINQISLFAVGSNTHVRILKDFWAQANVENANFSLCF
jgi:hypothetical protein